MSHVLVMWLKTGRARIFDVVSVRDVVDTKVGAAILQSPKDAGVVGAEVSIRWSEKYPAQIIAVGTLQQMEKRCRVVIKQGSGAASAGRSDESCDKCEDTLEVIASLKPKVADLEGENEKLQATVEYMTSYRDGIDDLASAVRDLRVVCAEMEARSVASTTNSQAKEPEGDTDIGGFFVRSSLLKMLEISHSKKPTMYARELLRQLFEPGELAGTSITGKKPNAHREKAAEPQLDPIRVNAVVKYTCKKFGLLKEGPVRSSLSSMLNKEKAAPPMDK